jgi:hypothetical protein
MLNTYIKNQGITKTIYHNNNDNHINQINWDADYDGDIANISINTNTDGRRNHYDIKLDNEDLANLLNIQSIDMPIDQRLKQDFYKPSYLQEPYYIELPKTKLEPIKPTSVEKLLSNHISSPLPNEELIIPLTLNKKTVDKYTLTPKRRHKRLKTHVTHRVFKKHKSSAKSRNKPKSSRKKTSTIMDFL